MSELDAEIDDAEIPDDIPYVNVDCAAAVFAGDALAPAVVEMEVMRASGREYPPAALAAIYTLIDPHYRTMRRSGIVGDAGHKRGYHRARAIVSSSDYSVQAPADKRGDSWACAGIDISFGPAEMKTATGRLMNACRPNSAGNYDPRIEPIREFFGTLNGSRVTGWNRYPSSNRGVGYATSDSSHLWHVHISVFREHVTDAVKMRGIADVLNGVPLKPGPPPPDEGDDMPSIEDILHAQLIDNPNPDAAANDKKVSLADITRMTYRKTHRTLEDTDNLQARMGKLESKLDAVLAALTKPQP